MAQAETKIVRPMTEAEIDCALTKVNREHATDECFRAVIASSSNLTTALCRLEASLYGPEPSRESQLMVRMAIDLFTPVRKALTHLGALAEHRLREHSDDE